MTETPLVSIGIPVHNGARYLRETIESVLAQTYNNLEIIISDNASTDNTAIISQECAASDDRIRYDRSDILIGVTENYRRVMDLSNGDYFAWLASDDQYKPTFVETVINYMQANPSVVLCATDVENIDDDGKPITYERGLRGLERLTPLYDVTAWERTRRLFFQVNVYEKIKVQYTMYGIYHARVLRTAGGTRPGYKGKLLLTEFPFLAKIAVQGAIAAVPQPLFVFRLHANNWHMTQRLNIVDSVIAALLVCIETSVVVLRSSLRITERLMLACSIWLSFPPMLFGHIRRRLRPESDRPRNAEADALHAG